MAGGSINFQQIPGIEPVLSLFKARPGHKLVCTDLASVEPRIVAVFSRDPTLLELYASGKPHDVYLYLAMHIFPDDAEAIRRVYDSTGKGPSDESRDAAKKQFGKLRKVSKEIQLACGYGASAWRVWQTLRLKGIDISLQECEALVQRFWVMYAGIKRWTRTLEREADERGGWILNGRGRPLAVPRHRRKDIGNMFAQSTGHDCLLTLVWHIDRVRAERKVEMHPWLADVHDATIFEVRDALVPAAREVFEEAYRRLDRELQSDVPLIGDVEVGDSLWKFKG